MAHYIDADLLRKEIERLYYNEAEKDESILAADAYKNALDAVEKFLDTLPEQEHPIYQLNQILLDWMREAKTDKEQEARFEAYKRFFELYDEYMMQEPEQPASEGLEKEVRKYLTDNFRTEDFKAGAEWMAGQWWKEVSATDYPKPDKDKIYCVYIQKDYPHYLLAKVINHPNDDELLQWRCTQFPFTRYDMCEGDSYLEIRKK